MQDQDAGGVEQVDLLIAQTQQELENVHERLAPLLQEQARAEARLKLLKEIRSTYQVHPPMEVSGSAGVESSANGAGMQSGPIGTRIRQQVAQVLEEAGKPMHSNEIYAEFLSRGWPIPGAGRAANITAHLSGSTEISSPRRGWWQLGPSSPRRAKTTKRAKKTTRKGK